MSRFANLSTEDIDNLLLAKDSESSNKSAERSFNIFSRYCKGKSEIVDIKTIESSALNDILTQFYAEARKEDESFYKKNKYVSLEVRVTTKNKNYTTRYKHNRR